MYNSKSSNLSPFHQVHRAQRDTSPSHRLSSKHGNKLYSSDQVTKMLKAYIEPKILFLKNQLQQKQRIIQILNEKLDENDKKIIKMHSYLQNIVRKQKQMQSYHNDSQSIQIINQILNDKIKQYWETVSTQLKKISFTFTDKIESDQKNIKNKIQQDIDQFKKNINQYIENTRLKNNNYWIKIKQVLNKLNSKITKVDQTILHLNQKLYHFQQNSTKQSSIVNELHKSKDVIKKLIQLKKSVKNIYENYENVLELQNKFRKNVQSFSSKQQDSNDLLDFQNQKLNLNKFNKQIRNDIHFKQAGNTFPMFHKKQYNNYKPIYQQSQDIIDLQYSREQQTGSAKKIINNNNNNFSPITNNDQEDKMFKNNFYIHQNNNTKKAFFINNSPAKLPSGQSGSKYENFLGSPHQVSSQAFSYMNITNNLNTQNSRSNSFVNLSLQHRREMSQSLKQRLQQLIELKSLSKPLIVYLDEINYLKNLEGNYIFDVKGNMFKVNKIDAKTLQDKGLLKFVDKKNIEQLKNNHNSMSISSNNVKQSLI